MAVDPTRVLEARVGAREGNEGGVNARDTESGVGLSDFERARNLIRLQHDGANLTPDSDQWLTDYLLTCPIERVVELHEELNILEIA